jgi:malate dehydrogenase (oxaloacetate-decarboxylating)(NADP+)
VLIWEATAVAEAAMKSGVAQLQIDLEEYREQLRRRLGRTYEVMQNIHQRAKAEPKRIVFSEGEHEKILRASLRLSQEKIAQPILLGRPTVIENKLRELGLGKLTAEIIEPARSPRFAAYVEEFFGLRQRYGITRTEAREWMLNNNYFGAMMVRMGDADGFIAGVSQHYPDTIRPSLQIISTRQGVQRVSGLYIIATKKDVYFFADTTVNIEPTAEQLAEIAILSAEVARRFNVEPRVAMLSFSNFGSTRHRLSDKVREATRLVKERAPDLMVDGEMQADTALVPELIGEDYPFSAIKAGANVLVFPSLEAGNIAYKLMMRIGGAEALGPILMGMEKPVHVLERGAEVEEIVNMAAIAVVHAQVGILGVQQPQSNAAESPAA